MKAETNTTTQAEFTCPKCPERGPFKSKAALDMHIRRVHTKQIQVPGEGMDKKERKRRAKRRKYQKDLRARYKLEGKDSRGYPLKKYPKFGAKWTAARRQKFQATWEAKKNNTTGKNSQHVEHLEDPREFINCCPNCGKNLVAHYLAEGAERRRHAK